MRAEILDWANSLRRDNVEEPMSAQDQRSRIGTDSRNPGRVLVVEDERVIALDLVNVLTDLGGSSR